MDKWKFTCVGCGEKEDVVCNNCKRNLFTGRKKGDYMWLECDHCKYENDQMSHACSFTPAFDSIDKYRPEEIHKQATTDFNANRDFFFNVGSEEHLNQSKFKNVFLPIIIFLILQISYVIYIWD